MSMMPGHSGSLRGALFESLVKRLALGCGYREVKTSPQDLQLYMLNKLPMVHGLGEGHNADVLLDHPFNLALMPQIRLLIECKGYKSPVGLDVIRGAVGMRLDLNAFRQLTALELAHRGQIKRPPRQVVSFPLYNVAVAGLHGFTANAQSFAATHHITLLDYSDLPLLGELANLIPAMDVRHFNIAEEQADDRASTIAEAVRLSFDHALETHSIDTLFVDLDAFGLQATADGIEKLRRIFIRVASLRYTYIATLPGGIHIHMLAREPLRLSPQADGVDLKFRLTYRTNERRHWELEPVAGGQGSELEFALPPVLADEWERNGFDPRYALNLKQGHFERIELLGPVVFGEGEPSIRHIVAGISKKSLEEARSGSRETKPRVR